MPGEILYWLINMSIIASLAGVVVLLIRYIGHLPRRAAVFFYLFPFIRMVLPFGVGAKYGLLSLLPRYAVKAVEVTDMAPMRKTVTMMNSMQFAESYAPFTYKKVSGEDLLENIFNVGFYFWAVIAAALLLTFAFIYFYTLFELRDAERDGRFDKRVRFSSKVTSPAVYGILFPRIILPESYKERDLTYILLHEKAHIGRCDNLWRLLGFAVCAVHWFNPLSWILLKYFLCDLECACDEKVLKKCGEEKRKEYAAALLDEAESKNLFLSASAFGGASIRLRIGRILSYKKLSAFSAAALAVFFAVIAYILLTNAA